MASKRHIRRKVCKQKKYYRTRYAALEAVRLYRQRFGQHLNAYRCCFCGGWHLGHPPRRIAIELRLDF